MMMTSPLLKFITNHFVWSLRTFPENLSSIAIFHPWHLKTWYISLIIHDYDVITGAMTKNKACSTNTTKLWTHCKKKWAKKFFVENLHAAVTYPLHYSSNKMLRSLLPFTYETHPIFPNWIVSLFALSAL